MGGISAKTRCLLKAAMVTNGFCRMFYQFGSSLYPPLASARYLGKWLSDGMLAGAIAIPGVASKILTAANFDGDGQLTSISVGSRTLLRQ